MLSPKVNAYAFTEIYAYFCIVFCLNGGQFLTGCMLVDSSTLIFWTSPLVILGASGLFRQFYSYNVDSDQTPHYVASDLGLHCLFVTLSRVSR